MFGYTGNAYNFVFVYYTVHAEISAVINFTDFVVTYIDSENLIHENLLVYNN